MLRSKFLFILILFISPIYLWASDGNVLKTEISLVCYNDDLGSVLTKIENLTDVSFVYRTDVVNKTLKVSINVKQTSLENVLRILFFNNDINFAAVGSQIILFRKEQKATAEPVRDTIWTKVIDTTTITIKTHIQYLDTITVYDTVVINKKTKPQKPQEKPKQNFITLDYSINYQTLQFATPDNSYMKLDKGNIIENNINLTVGKTSKNWEIHSGVGISILNQHTPYSVSIPYTYTETDSVAGYKVSYDSAYIAVATIDTIWLVDQRIDIVYSKKYYKINATQKDNGNSKNTLYYLTIPIRLNFKKLIHKKHAFVLSLEANTHILLSKDFDEPQYTYDTLNIHSNISPSSAYTTGTLAIGFDFMLWKNTFLSILPKVNYAFTPMFNSTDYQYRNRIGAGINIGLKRYF